MNDQAILIFTFRDSPHKGNLSLDHRALSYHFEVTKARLISTDSKFFLKLI